MPVLPELFFSFAKIGLFTFGGGHAMIALIERECVQKKQWITHEDMMNLIVVAESTPGPIALNCATYVGWKKKKLAGALTATLGMILPSFLIIYAISLWLEGFLEIGWVASAFRGIKVAVGILMIDAAVTMIRKMPKKTLPCLIAGLSFTIMCAVNFLGLKLSSLTLMLAAGAVSLAVFFVRRSAKRKGRDA